MKQHGTGKEPKKHTNRMKNSGIDAFMDENLICGGFQHSWLENSMNSMKKQKDMTLKDEPPMSVCTGEEWKNSSRMKKLSQSGNNVQLWMFLVVKVKSDVFKNNIM